MMDGADGFLADTNVVSEGAKPRPNARVTAWAESAFERTFLSAAVIAEIHRGIALLPEDTPGMKSSARAPPGRVRRNG